MYLPGFALCFTYSHLYITHQGCSKSFEQVLIARGKKKKKFREMRLVSFNKNISFCTRAVNIREKRPHRHRVIFVT